MSSPNFVFPVHFVISEKDIAAITDPEVLEKMWQQNDFDTDELGKAFRANFNNAPEYYDAFLQAKLPLDTNDGNIQIRMLELHLAEVERERAAREVRKAELAFKGQVVAA